MFDVTSATSFRRTPLFPPEFRKKIERKPARRVRPGGARAGKVFLMRRNRTTECPRLGTSAKRAASGRTFARRSATACVEFAVVLPILLTFVLGVLEVGRFIQVYEILNAAAREGARQASTGQMTNAQVIAAVTGCVQASGLPTAQLNVTVQDLTNAGTDVSQATILDNLQVTVSLPYKTVEWITTSYFLNSSTQISTTVYWISANPQSYPNSVTAPTGS